MNKPERADQFNIDHWNQNTDIIDNQLKSNADDISSESTRATNAESALRNITDLTFKTVLLNFCYPIGSLYWSSNSTDPAQLFGGTWTQIKDRFIWAKGDSDAVNATGGAKTVTLTVNNLPSHTHSFTPAGSVSSHTHTFSHTHGYTPSGKIASTSGGTDNKTAIGGEHNHGLIQRWDSSPGGTTNDGLPPCSRGGNVPSGYTNVAIGYNGSHTHNAYFTGTAGTTTSQSTTTTDSTTPTFTGDTGTTGATGNGTPVDIMPPYITAYCWRRTA